MTRLDLVKQFADESTQPIESFIDATAEAGTALVRAEPTDATAALAYVPPADLFVWFEDTSARREHGLRGGIAGLPECLLPWPAADAGTMKVIDRRYAEGHLHLLAAVRLRCSDKCGERIAAIYTAALSVGTIAWIGTGAQYERAWAEMYFEE